MTRDEFKTIVKVLKAIYTDPKFLPDHNAFEVWYGFMKDCDYQTTALVVESYVATNRFPPTIADLREPLLDEDEDPLEAWGLVLKALRNGISGADEAYAKLPPKVQMAVGTPLNIEAWARMSSETLNSVTQSQFISSYKTVCAREHKNGKATPSVKAIIAPPVTAELPMMDDEPKRELPFIEVDESPFTPKRNPMAIEDYLEHRGVKHLRDILEAAGV